MLLVVGGQARKAGKTALVAAIIGKFRAMEWTAVKVSPHAHGADSGAREELMPGPSDTGRMIAAGAKRAIFLCERREELARTVQSLARSANTIAESNAVAELVRPSAYLFVVNASCSELKPSSRRTMRRADAFVVVEMPQSRRLRPEVQAFMGAKRRFVVKPPNYASAALCAFLRNRFSELASI